MAATARLAGSAASLAATRPEDERGLTIALESVAALDMIERCYAMWDRLTQKSC